MRLLRLAALGALVLLTLASFAPILSAFGALFLATALDCRLDEGGTYPCRLAGTDIGGALNTALVMGWLAFLTWPGMLACLLLWPVVAVLAWRRRRAARGGTTRGGAA